ncbi:3-deoxy-manno-octulosonate cytidylyltransferase [Desulfatirhabdium butyrativorans]|uniref:3-deoxy-manno-octulosonate cytidylyltransferase n=1 Tax=Desulfatirhabdium butyrativorans TaxID=340467 RepID=UPI000401B70D|nr:3-deoxy-manno-octulosonate cytidylyltransferase [Desulfatirhabdium butyrativorans]
MSICAIIPSRWGSTRFAGKPLARICGKPMIQHVVERVSQSKTIDMLAVATDDLRIEGCVKDFGCRVIRTGSENRSGSDRVAEAADLLGLSGTDIVVNVQGDQPLVHPESIDDVISPLVADEAVVMSTLAFKIVRPEEITNPKDVKLVCDRRGFALYFSRSAIPFGRDPGVVFDTYKHLGVYAYRKAFLDIFCSLETGELERIEQLEQLRALENGYAIRVVATRHDSPEVDLPEDIARIEELIKNPPS